MTLRLLCLMTALVALQGCAWPGSSKNTLEPVGIGSGRDEYKQSPCACMLVPQVPPDAQWWERMRAWAAGAG